MSAGVHARLILLRHGESTANATDRFGGWQDFPLTIAGQGQAVRAAELMRRACLTPHVVHTSLLTRAIDTADLVSRQLGIEDVETRRSWRLNERHYGTLEGRLREEVLREHGSERFREWRRSYDSVPPPVPITDSRHPVYDDRYATIPASELPGSESLADVVERLVPYWDDRITSRIRAGSTTLVVAHQNSLRALCMYLDGLTADEVRSLEIPICVPLRYDLDAQLRPLIRRGHYLADETVPNDSDCYQRFD